MDECWTEHYYAVIMREGVASLQATGEDGRTRDNKGCKQTN